MTARNRNRRQRVQTVASACSGARPRARIAPAHRSFGLALTVGLLFCCGVLRAGSAHAQSESVRQQIRPGQSVCTRSVPAITPGRSIRVEVDVLTLAGDPLDPASRPLTLSVGLRQSDRNAILPSRLLIEGPILPSVFPSNERFQLTHAQFGDLTNGREITACIMNPEGNPEFRLTLSQTSVFQNVTRTPDLRPVFMGDRVIITCCSPNGGLDSCVKVNARVDSPAGFDVCPTGKLPVL